MKKIYFLLIAVAVTATAWSQTTRQWAGTATTESWTDPTNWETVPGGAQGVPLTGDIIIFDAATTTVTNVPSITLGGLTVRNLSTIALVNSTLNNKITIADGVNAIDFSVEAGSTLVLTDGSPAGVDVSLKQDELVRASIAGQFEVGAGRTYEANLNGVNTDVTGTLVNRALVIGNMTRLNFLAGSTYIHNLDEGDIPDASWNLASTCRITGSVFNGPRFLNRAFGNFTWDCAGQKRVTKLAAAGMSVAGTFSVVNTGESWLEMDDENLTVGNLSLSGGTFTMATGILDIGFPLPFPVSRTIHIAGNVTVENDAILVMSTDDAGGLGRLNIGGNFTQNGGTITETSNLLGGAIYFRGAAVQTFSKNPAAIISNEIDFQIIDNAKVDFGTSVLNGSAGDFTLNSGCKIITSHPNGLGANGSIQINKSFSQSADYEFRGATTGSFATAFNQVRNLTINNTTTGEVLAQRNFQVNGALTLMNGYLTATAGQILIHSTGSASSTNGAFVNGPLSKRTNSTAAFTFHVGKVDGGLHTIGVKPTAASVSIFTAQYFRAPAPTATLGAGLVAVSYCEYWDLARTGGTSPATVTLSWETTSPCGSGGYVSSPADLRVGHLTGGIWKSEGNAFITGNPASGTVTSNTITTFSPFALATSSSSNSLPVVFADVKAYEKNDGVQIEWSNLTEEDVATYTIERSTNGRDFSAIGTQLPTSNQNNKASYTAFDAVPAQGINYYRIKAEETTGKIVYTQILSVTIGKSGAGLRLYPNPVTGNHVTISMSNVKRGQYNLKVVNVAGQEIFKQMINNNTSNITQTLDLPSSVKPGVYSLIVTGDGYRETKTFIIR